MTSLAFVADVTQDLQPTVLTVAPIRAWYDIANAEHTNVEESLQT